MAAKNTKKKISFVNGSLRVIVGVFLVLILLGTILLALPIAAKSGRSIGLFDSLFTATSAVCVTGLVVRDTGSTFSLFGQIVLMLLIQIGGLGFMTFAMIAIRISGRRISLRERMLIRESMNEDTLEGMDVLIRWVAVSAFAVEFTGAALLSVRFIPQYGIGKGIFYALFHAVSAFCNAGFDLIGRGGSLTAYRADALVNLTVIFLVVAGGLGFGVLRDITSSHKRHGLHLQTRVVLVAYGTLFVFGFLFTLLAEWNNSLTLGDLPTGEKLLAALFQSVTLRTAGFNTINEQSLRPANKLISSILMLIGASPASTGGGVKVTTVAVILLSVTSTAKGKDSVSVFRREVPAGLVRRALAVLFIALAVVIVDVTVISLLQPHLNFMDILMECASAMGTVGLSAFGSARLCTVSRILIIITMFLGRIGPLSMAIILARRADRENAVIRYPEGHIMIG